MEKNQENSMNDQRFPAGDAKEDEDQLAKTPTILSVNSETNTKYI